MHVALVLLLCSTMVSVGVSQSPPTVTNRTDTVAPVIQTCHPSDLRAFILSLPNGVQCESGIGILSNPSTNPSATPAQVANALANVCHDDCGGFFSKYLEIPCSDQPAAEILRITCTPTNGSATIGDLCRFALPSVLDSQLLDELSLCDNVTSDDTSCTPHCMETLIKLKSQIGCCLQNVYNNTIYDIQRFLDDGFLTQSKFDSLQKLTAPDSNPWTVCAVEPPKRCGAPLFKPPCSTCTPDDYFDFLTSLPNSSVCSQSITTVFTVPTTDSTELANALENMCTDDCGGVYSEFLKSTCNNQLEAESLRIYCVPVSYTHLTLPTIYSV